MKYVRDTLNYYRESDKRIEDVREINRLAREQTERETLGEREINRSPFLGIISVLVIAIIVGIVYAGYVAVTSIDNPDDLFENPTVLCIFAGVFLLVGCIFAVIPLSRAILLKVKCKEESYAKCIGFEDKTVVNKKRSYVVSCPVFSLNENGQEYIIYDGKYSRRIADIHIGDQVPVTFDSNNPNNCIIDGKSNWNILSLVIGVVFIALAIVILFVCL